MTYMHLHLCIYTLGVFAGVNVCKHASPMECPGTNAIHGAVVYSPHECSMQVRWHLIEIDQVVFGMG